MKFFLAGPLVLLSVVNLAYAGSGGKLEDPAADCHSAKTESAMSDCLASQLKKADAELNRRYRELATRYQDNGRPAHSSSKSQDVYLQKAEKAWMAFRDESCNLETYESMDGSGFATILTECLLKYTQERTAYLKALLDQP